ncbi:MULTISPECIES: ArsC family reductase [Pseudoalteromonas]|uniref:Transcriptional regulator, Spx/MgsR family n=1 Tax=Pseudoalteromonas luteoviolacea (strain 2ta16) TaxID=1353533 RepID=V4HZ34_PSEL2|nr:MULTISPECIES: ArsC family reductase [Pseudoalteromonas]ESP93209.1 transcriptional regulator, Spx/MgsR family [Pseudoalteromonas luteoviolacea 2ta16]KZN37082.1 glutathione-dependent thiol reductase [Pseudoalteromonas luteoviolacea NCIMB 1944]MCG7550011.1 ArsC family reductase [Pseudoalteromonas sp. Of7M-16]
MSIVLYGIPNCDTIKKAKKFLQDNNVEFTFHDYRKDGLTPELLDSFVEQLGWEAVLNKRGTTYRALSDEQKQNLNETSAKQYMLESPAMIKRPILQRNTELHVGFKAAQYQEIFK